MYVLWFFVCVFTVLLNVDPQSDVDDPHMVIPRKLHVGRSQMVIPPPRPHHRFDSDVDVPRMVILPPPPYHFDSDVDRPHQMVITPPPPHHFDSDVDNPQMVIPPPLPHHHLDSDIGDPQMIIPPPPPYKFSQSDVGGASNGHSTPSTTSSSWFECWRLSNG